MENYCKQRTLSSASPSGSVSLVPVFVSFFHSTKTFGRYSAPVIFGSWSKEGEVTDDVMDDKKLSVHAGCACDLHEHWAWLA
jgi:hypothetical protein